MTFYEFNRRFPSEEAAIGYFYKVRYGGVLTCPHCGAKVRVYRLRKKLKVFHCKNCNDSFSPFAGTVFERSSTDIRKWFYAIHLFLNGKKGISGCQLQREVGVTYKTAWRMLQKIREAMGNVDMCKVFSVFVEVDETYVGGRPRRDNAKLDETGNVVPPTKEPLKRGRGTRKTPVVGVKERDSSKVYATVALPNDAGQKLTGKQLLAIIQTVCKEGATVATDDFSSYNILDRNNFTHVTVNHSLGQFSAGNGVHTNNIENFWSILQRGILGVYHHVSTKYLQRYLDEFCFRQNNRENLHDFDIVLRQAVLKAA